MSKRKLAGALASAAILSASLVWSAPSAAWGSAGHQYVGNLAWALLNPNARAHVRQLLGLNVTLGQAAVWPDCVRSVKGSPSTGFHFDSDRYTPQACLVFANSAAEVQRITDYAGRNWTNCEYSGHSTKCNLSFHFADVNIRDHDQYDASYFGAEPYDVVHAIEAAETVLRCNNGLVCQAPAPFSISDKREALFLLAHFVGDVHQPLHVGAIYLDGANLETGDDGAPTVGGNLLLLSAGNTGNNLHHSWDEIPDSLGTAPSAAAIRSACQIAPLPNPVADPPEKWAGESILAARTAYQGMTFTRDVSEKKYWDIAFQDPAKYRSMRRAFQVQRLIAGGARLAEVLNSIWPSKTAAKACRGAVR